jgi:hypothetical protein
MPILDENYSLDMPEPSLLLELIEADLPKIGEEFRSAMGALLELIRRFEAKRKPTIAEREAVKSLYWLLGNWNYQAGNHEAIRLGGMALQNVARLVEGPKVIGRTNRQAVAQAFLDAVSNDGVTKHNPLVRAIRAKTGLSRSTIETHLKTFKKSGPGR